MLSNISVLKKSLAGKGSTNNLASICVSVPFRLHVEGRAELRQQQTGEVVLLLELLRKLKKSQDPLLLLETT